MTVRTKDDVMHSSAGPSQPFCPQMPLRQNPVESRRGGTPRSGVVALAAAGLGQAAADHVADAQ
jgi:hypothetical protein